MIRTHSFITGGAGFIGSHLAELLLDQGHRVTVLDDLSTGRYANVAQLDLRFLASRRVFLQVRKVPCKRGFDCKPIVHCFARLFQAAEFSQSSAKIKVNGGENSFDFN